MGVIKMNKNIKLASVVLGLGLVLFTYQNCSQIQPGLLVTDNKASALSVDDGTQAIIFDEQDNIIEVVPEQQAVVQEEQPAVAEQQDAEPVVQEEAAPAQIPTSLPVAVKENHSDDDNDHDDREHKDKDKDDKNEIVKDEHEDTPEEIQASSCVELAKKHKDAIDVSTLAVGAKIALVKGKTFIYSSTGPKAISSLSIGKACGRTILCDVTIERIGEVNGRLDLYRDSSVREYGIQPKNIKYSQ